MPFYEYQCQNCQYYTEVMQKITDAPLKKCPSCGRMTLVKLISAPVFRLKGSGWYETDFKSDQERKRNLAGADAEAPKSAETAAPSGEKSSAKSAEASDTKRAAAVSAPAAKPAARKRAKPPARPAARAARGGEAPRALQAVSA